MKKFVLAFGIPVLAVASLIGSGYATWYFNNAVESVVGKIGVNITPKQVVGAKFEQTGNNFEDMKLVLDQTPKTDGMPTGRLGVHFEGGFSESLIADDGDATNDTPTSKDKFVIGTTYKITTTITIPSKVAEYVNFTFEGSTASEDGLTLTKEHTFIAKDVHEEKFFTISHVTATSDVTVAYAEGQEPSTLDAYTAMVNALSGNPTIGISFTAEIVK